MSRFIETCSACKEQVVIVAEGKGKSTNWVVYNFEDYGPHRCKIARDGRKFLKESGWYGCRACGRIIKCITMSDKKKFIIGPSGNRHICDERDLHPRDRFWSGDGSYPWEYPIVDGVPQLTIKPSDGKPRVPKTMPVVWRDSDHELLDEALSYKPLEEKDKNEIQRQPNRDNSPG